MSSGGEPEHRRVLDRVERDTQGLLGSSLRRAGDHFAGRDGEGPEGGASDAVEVWGRRIGRALSVVLAVALVAWLGFQLGWFGGTGP